MFAREAGRVKNYISCAEKDIRIWLLKVILPGHGDGSIPFASLRVPRRRPLSWTLTQDRFTTQGWSPELSRPGLLSARPCGLVVGGARRSAQDSWSALCLRRHPDEQSRLVWHPAPAPCVHGCQGRF